MKDRCKVLMRKFSFTKTSVFLFICSCVVLFSSCGMPNLLFVETAYKKENEDFVFTLNSEHAVISPIQKQNGIMLFYVITNDSNAPSRTELFKNKLAGSSSRIGSASPFSLTVSQRYEDSTGKIFLYPFTYLYNSIPNAFDTEEGLVIPLKDSHQGNNPNAFKMSFSFQVENLNEEIIVTTSYGDNNDIKTVSLRNYAGKTFMPLPPEQESKEYKDYWHYQNANNETLERLTTPVLHVYAAVFLHAQQDADYYSNYYWSQLVNIGSYKLY